MWCRNCTIQIFMESTNCPLLPTPVEKQNISFERKYPFPIIRNDGKSEWRCAEGHLQEDCVLVNNAEDIKLLFTHGFFGKGTHSKHAPKICLNQQRHESKVYKEEPTETAGTNEENSITDECNSPVSKKPEDIELIEVSDDSSDEEKNIKTENQDDDVMEIVISDSDSHSDEEINIPSESRSNARNVVRKNSCSNVDDEECLQLTFEEAYFLSYALGCLVIKDDKNQYVNLIKLWNIFCDASPDKDFPIMYTAYHHFRSKNWVVKSGVKYGVDYVLYKDGPPFCHATYSVIVKPVKEKGFRDTQNSRQMTWASLMALDRLNTAAGKKLMFLYVIKPSAISENKISTPLCVSHFQVEEVLFQRWVPAENREAEINE